MSIGTPVQRKSVSEVGQTATTVENPATTIAAGTLAVMLIVSGQSKIASSIVDSVSNPWTVNFTGNGGSGTKYISVGSCQVATQITSANTITTTWSNSTSAAHEIWIYEVPFAATSLAFDKSAIANGTTVAVSSGNTAALSQADEVVFGISNINVGARTFTPGSGYSQSLNPLRGNSSAVEYKVVAATTAVAATGTWSGADGTATVTAVVTFKGLATSRVQRNPAINFQDPAVLSRIFVPRLWRPKLWRPGEPLAI